MNIKIEVDGEELDVDKFLNSNPKWFDDLSICKEYINEVSIDFRNYLNENGIENETVKIDKFESGFFNTEISKQYSQDCYLFIDKNIYSNVGDILIKEGLEKHLNDVCYILKKTFYKVQLFKLNDHLKKRRSEFNEELYKVFKAIKENTEFEKIVFHANEKEKRLVLSSPDIIKLIIESFKSQILDSEYTDQYLYARKVEADLNKRDSDYAKILLDIITVELLLFLHKNTTYNAITTGEAASQNIFTNKELALVFKLLQAGLIIDDDTNKYSKIVFAIPNSESQSKDFLRTRVKRYFENNPEILDFFKNSYSELDFIRAALKSLRDQFNYLNGLTE